MKVVSFLTRTTLQRRIAPALRGQPFVVDTAVSANECLQFTQLVRYEAILVDADPLTLGDVVTLVERLRQVNTDASLFVFARYFDL
jgi:ActR/RegA family two-component response regulator